ncbi:putative Rossmann-fold nucleotide-binding protein [Calidifontibacter indicus]|uniref:Putative Rossmann-fold nucleotide-binding protein n=1 Tax=Calidifontibacter indicus TaxID=419650 RepID=A0A3D9UMY4_9MICO|nr:Rossmann fold nucleotide-binding protein [Calidifontibacter indicus]REF30687.1 putative Rossmann-fold nucleotide-binding protein [Calidifontibacter indicus]
MTPPEVESLAVLDRLLHGPDDALRHARLQNLDLAARESELLDHKDFHGVVVLGGNLTTDLERHMRKHGAVVFISDPSTPVSSFRSELYDYTELYAGLNDRGYAQTPDASAYRWSRDARSEHDAYATLQRAVHDDCISDALHEWVAGRRVAGVMGGHAVRRGTPGFAEAAGLGAHLANAGLSVATGGGPGAMEAANLGALLGDSPDLQRALTDLAKAPDFHDVDAWAKAAWAVRERVQPVSDHRSLGVPTWFYGHEPPNLFGSAIAKYFSNALREDVLLAICNAGIAVLPGAAGTVQEIFQVATRLYYATEPGPPLVLVGRDQWTVRVPVWAALEALGAKSPLGASIHLVDTVDEAATVLLDGATR